MLQAQGSDGGDREARDAWMACCRVAGECRPERSGCAWHEEDAETLEEWRGRPARQAHEARRDLKALKQDTAWATATKHARPPRHRLRNVRRGTSSSQASSPGPSASAYDRVESVSRVQQRRRGAGGANGLAFKRNEFKVLHARSREGRLGITMKDAAPRTRDQGHLREDDDHVSITSADNRSRRRRRLARISVRPRLPTRPSGQPGRDHRRRRRPPRRRRRTGASSGCSAGGSGRSGRR